MYLGDLTVESSDKELKKYKERMLNEKLAKVH
jgi:hypothetical protein